MSKSISILSLNCFGAPHSLSWEKRYDKLTKEIKKLQPDVILLQEVISDNQRKFLIANLGQKYAFRSTSQFNRFNRYGGLFTLSKLDVLDYSFTKYKTQGPLLSLLATADRLLQKGYESFKIKVGDKKINIINTHLYANYRNRKNEIKTVFEQIKQLFMFIESIPQDEIVLIGGDFNIEKGTEMYIEFLRATGLKDPLYSSSVITLSKKNFNTNIFLQRFDKKIDHLLIRNIKLNNISQRIVFKKPFKVGKKNYHISDHFGIFTKISL